MDRRGFLKRLLGIAAVAATPVSFVLTWSKDKWFVNGEKQLAEEAANRWYHMITFVDRGEPPKVFINGIEREQWEKMTPEERERWRRNTIM